MTSLQKILNEIREAARKLLPKPVKPKYRLLGTAKVTHYFGGGMTKVRKDIRKSRELLTRLDYAKVKQKEVEVRYIERIHPGKYIPAGIRRNVPLGNR